MISSGSCCCFFRLCKTTMLGVILLTALLQPGTSATYNDSVRLYDDFIKPFNHRIRPATNQSTPLPVYFVFNLLNLLNVVELEQTVSLNAWLNFTWVDEIRQWDPEDYGGMDSLSPDPLDIWRPRILISNSVKKRDIFEDDYAPLNLFSSGLTEWFPSSIISYSCVLDMTFFPFDQQSCSILILAKQHKDVINLIPGRPDVNIGGYIPNGEWDLASTEVRDNQPVFGGSRLSRVTITLNFRRRPLFYMINVLVPVIFMSLLSTFVFVLPEESGERASFSITVLLSLSVFMGMVSGQLPQNSESFPIIILYLFALLIHNGVCVIFCVAQLRWIKMKSEDGSPKNIVYYKHVCVKNPVNNPESLGQTLVPEDNDRKMDSYSTARIKHERQKNDNGKNSKSFIISNGNLEKIPNAICGHTGSENQGNCFISRKDDDQLMKEDEENSKNVLKMFCKWLKNSNVQLFLFFNLIWIAISSYFLHRLLHQV